MSTSSQPGPDQRAAIRDEAARLEESAKWSAQGQFEAAKAWRTSNWVLGGFTTASSGVAGVLAFATDTLQVVAGILAICAAITAAVHTTLKPDKRAELAQGAGNDYLTLQGDARRLLSLDSPQGDLDTLRKNLDSLAKRQSEINHRADVTPRFAYKRAKKNIDSGGQRYEVDS